MDDELESEIWEIALDEECDSESTHAKICKLIEQARASSCTFSEEDVEKVARLGFHNYHWATSQRSDDERFVKG